MKYAIESEEAYALINFCSLISIIVPYIFPLQLFLPFFYICLGDQVYLPSTFMLHTLWFIFLYHFC